MTHVTRVVTHQPPLPTEGGLRVITQIGGYAWLFRVVRGFPFDRPAYKDWAFWLSLLWCAFLVPGIIFQWSERPQGSLVVFGVIADVLLLVAPLGALVGIRAGIRSRRGRGSMPLVPPSPPTPPPLPPEDANNTTPPNPYDSL